MSDNELENQLDENQIDELSDKEFESAFYEDNESLGEKSSSLQEQSELIANEIANQEQEIQKVIDENPYLNESQIRDLFEQNNQRLFGKIGEVQRKIKRIEQLAQQQYANNSSRAAELSPEMFSNISQEFGEDIAVAMARDLSQIQLVQQQSIPEAQLNHLVSQRTDALRNEFETRITQMRHPDLFQISASDDFKGWVAQLPADVQGKLSSSWNSDFISDALTAYKKDVELHQKNLREEEQKRNNAQKVKDKRLQSAVMPKSSRSQSDDFDDDFESAFYSDD